MPKRIVETILIIISAQMASALPEHFEFTLDLWPQAWVCRSCYLLLSMVRNSISGIKGNIMRYCNPVADACSAFRCEF